MTKIGPGVKINTKIRITKENTKNTYKIFFFGGGGGKLFAYFRLLRSVLEPNSRRKASDD